MLKVNKILFSDKSSVFLRSQPQVASFYNEEQLPNHQSESPHFFNRQEFDQYGDEDQIPQSPGDFSSQLSSNPETGKLVPLDTKLLARMIQSSFNPNQFSLIRSFKMAYFFLSDFCA